MNNPSLWIYILLMILFTNFIRVLPVTVLRKKIQNRFLRSFLFYVPYVTLAVMTFPAIMDSTMHPLAGLAALVCGIVAAFFGLGLFPVSIICCVIVFLLEWFLVP